MAIFVKKSIQLLTISPQNTPTAKLHNYLLSAVAPRPIALASTMDGQGKPNLSPFSFFNVFSANPIPVMTKQFLQYPSLGVGQGFCKGIDRGTSIKSGNLLTEWVYWGIVQGG